MLFKRRIYDQWIEIYTTATEFYSATGLDLVCQCSRLPSWPTMRRHEHLQAPGEAEKALVDFRIKPVKAL